MRVFASLLITIGFLTCLGSTMVQTTTYASDSGPLGPLAVVNFAGEHTQTMVLLTGGIMIVAGAVMLYGEMIVLLLSQIRDRSGS